MEPDQFGAIITFLATKTSFVDMVVFGYEGLGLTEDTATRRAIDGEVGTLKLWSEVSGLLKNGVLLWVRYLDGSIGMLGFDNVLARLDGLAYGGCFPNLRPGGRLDGASDSFTIPFSRLLTV